MLLRAGQTALRRSCARYPAAHSSSSRRLMACAAAGGGDRGATVQHMAVTELKELLSNPTVLCEVQFVDVREPWEFETAKLPHFKLFPLSEASKWADTIDADLDPETETLVLCHHGMRSMQMSGFLVSKGFTNVKNITGGIAAYSQVDRSIPEY